jgi:RHS repeat-associated protein
LVVYGNLWALTGSASTTLRFPGQMLQAESGLFYNWNRQYDPTTGRYTQPDSLGLVDGPSRYAYVSNDPLQKVDPTGLAGLDMQCVAQDFIAKNCRGSIMSVFPGEHLDCTPQEIWDDAAGGIRAAKTEKKLLNEGRFRK